MTDLEISVAQVEPAELSTPLLVIQQFERDVGPLPSAMSVDAVLKGRIAYAIESGDFRGRRDEVLMFYPDVGSAGPERVLLVGVGKREDFTLESVRRAVGVAVRQAQRIGVAEMALALGHIEALSEHMGSYFAARGAVEAAVLATWSFREFKTSEDEGQRDTLRRLVLTARDEKDAGAMERGAAYARIAAGAENYARELATRPGNDATPSFLADAATRLGEQRGFEVTVLDQEAMEREGMKALLSVARGSEEPPRFIVMEYRGGGPDAQPVVLVGKGVTFDAGGISIKPAHRMEEMKYDMSGAAAVIAAMGAIATMKLKVNVVGLCPSTENLPSGRALKPGDVIGSHLGKTIEVVNTDAEGRLILVDALSYARRFKPRAIVDAATLTGAVGVALGRHAIGLMGNDGTLIDEVRAAGQRVGQRCWPLPLWDEYRRQLDSPIADIKNTGGRYAGTITAGWFLKEFAGEIPWAHLDIAGTAWSDEDDPPLGKGSTGVPTRLFIEWVGSRAEQ